jgi:hypothetical protein
MLRLQDQWRLDGDNEPMVPRRRQQRKHSISTNDHAFSLVGPSHGTGVTPIAPPPIPYAQHITHSHLMDMAPTTSPFHPTGTTANSPLSHPRGATPTVPAPSHPLGVPPKAPLFLGRVASLFGRDDDMTGHLQKILA